MRKSDFKPAPLRIDWQNLYSPAVSWVRLLENHVVNYYNTGSPAALRYLAVY